MNRGQAQVILLLLFSTVVAGQQSRAVDSVRVLALNRELDAAVISKQLAVLDSGYAEDFVFTHGTGLIEGKAGWMKTVVTTRYLLREHDSVTLEWHPGLVLAKGRLRVQKLDGEKTVSYHLNYIRVYVLRQPRWQLISHQTTREEHD